MSYKPTHSLLEMAIASMFKLAGLGASPARMEHVVRGTVRRPLIVAALVAGLVGCAPMVWERPGATQADYNRDSYACERDARQSGYFGTGLVGSLNMQDFFKRCMVAQGYSLRAGENSSVSKAPAAESNSPLSDEECLARFGVKCPPYLQRSR